MKRTHLLSIALLPLIAVAQAQDKVDLTFKSSSQDLAKKYRVTLKIQENSSMEISGILSAKTSVSETTKKAQLELSCADFKCLADGQPSEDMPAPAKKSFTVDKFGLPPSLTVQSDQALFTAFFVARMNPAQPLAVGESFKWDWKGESNAGKISGEGKLVELVERQGRKLALVKSKVEFQPDDVDSPADATIESWFDTATGVLVESKISGSVQDGTFTITVVEQK